MKEHGVSKRAKDVIVESLSLWAEQPAEMSDAPNGLGKVVESIIQNLDAAGYSIEMKVPAGSDVRATEIGHQALKVRRAEVAIKDWLLEQGKRGSDARAQQAPAWKDYEREYDRFKSVVAQAARG